ncbi:HK97 gp10 family phage protein [Rossellomorea vietnamensis]|uniref:HK97 gp10 family phage protein n=1 Tax=Rossellomorea vietnamensis TaxID=218284 RepID=A0A5D4KEG7_9BACI|nr:HK97 gp10 family phage protein [Rossellomorea vietnamensis]TYR75582.1 HK97 gp10 family phage protein [Rossellomorea vietnamensis]
MIDLSKEIAKTLSIYTKEVTKGLEREKLRTAKDTVEILMHTSPIGHTGEYLEGWDKKKVGTAQVVYNRTDYHLTHLLEKGHAKRGGGRVAAQVHIAPAEQQAIDDYVKRVEKVIKG